MKRKFKFIVSVASLMLSIAFIVVGVYALAEKRAVGITGTIKFTSENVLASVFVYEYLGATSPETLTTDSGYSVGEMPFNFDEGGQTSGNITLGTSTNIGGTDGDIILNDNTCVYTFVVKIQNDFTAVSSAINITFVTEPTTGIQSDYTITKITDGLSQIDGQANTIHAWQYTIRTFDLTQGAFTIPVSLEVVLSNALPE